MFLHNRFTLLYSRKPWSPSFVDQEPVARRPFFHGLCGGGGFRIIQVHYIYHVLYFYYSSISFTSDHQALYPRG